MPEVILSDTIQIKNQKAEENFLSQSEYKSIIDTTEPSYTVIEYNVDEICNEWEQYVLNHPDAHIFQHPLWLKALEHENRIGGKVLVCLNNQQEISGVLPLLPTRGLPFKQKEFVTTRRYSSLPRSPLSAFLFSNSDARNSLLQHAVKFVKDKNNVLLQLKSYSNELTCGYPEITKILWRYSYTSELPEKPENIRFGNKESHHKVKWSVNKAKNLGIVVREATSLEDLRNWYGLYLETMRYHMVAVRSFRFVKFLWENLKPKGYLTLFLAEVVEKNEKKLLAGSIFLHFNKTFFYSFNGRCPTALATHANDLIQWEAIHMAIASGFKEYDMGEVSCDNPSLIQFKTKWGCSAKPVYHYYYPLAKNPSLKRMDVSAQMQFRKIIWRYVPLIVTRGWGVLTNRFL